MFKYPQPPEFELYRFEISEAAQRAILGLKLQMYVLEQFYSKDKKYSELYEDLKAAREYAEKINFKLPPKKEK